MVHFQSADRVHLFQHWLRPRRVIGQASDLVDVLSQLKKVFGWNGFHQEMRRDIMWGICGKTLDKMGLGPHILARGLDPPISAKTLDHPILAAHPSQGSDHRFYPCTVLLRPILARGWTTHFINKKGWTTPFYWLGWGVQGVFLRCFASKRNMFFHDFGTTVPQFRWDCDLAFEFLALVWSVLCKAVSIWIDSV